MDNREKNKTGYNPQYDILPPGHTTWIIEKNKTGYNTDCGILPRITQHGQQREEQDRI